MSQAAANWGRHLVPRMTCPSCWHAFPPEDVHFIAERPDMLGDPVLGRDAFLRFAPARFTLRGEAIGPKGVVSSKYACPRCHMEIPGVLLEVLPLFVSVIGSPASGKSYLLTAMVNRLRTVLPQATLKFTDADAERNSAVKRYEETLFNNPSPDVPTQIHKTQADDMSLHRVVTLDGAPVRLPLPLQFTVWPMEGHPNFAQPHRVGRVLVLYDNAGEDFLPGAPEAGSAAIRHLACSDIMMMLFDPTQEPRLAPLCSRTDPQLSVGLRPEGTAAGLLSQEALLNAVATRARRYLGVAQTARLKTPLVIIVPKFDLFRDLPGVDLGLEDEPHARPLPRRALALNVARVDAVSTALQALLRRHCPEFVATVEGFSERICYIPVSSLGGSPLVVDRGDTRFYGIRPRDIRPRWVTAPLLYCMTKWASVLLAPPAGRA